MGPGPDARAARNWEESTAGRRGETGEVVSHDPIERWEWEGGALAPRVRVPAAVFTRIVCGVDGTPAGLVAVRQAQVLRTPGSTLHLVAVADPTGASFAGWSAAEAAEAVERAAHAALRSARELAGPEATVRLLRGRAAACLLREAERADASLVCVGSRDRSRLAGVLFEDVGTTMLHEARASVLVARDRGGGAFPRSIVVGVDGSSCAAAAHAVAGWLAKRFSAALSVVSAEDGKPVPALLAASRESDLLVVGSRGLRGARALGSVSERVAHRAPCSVLVVRT